MDCIAYMNRLSKLVAKKGILYNFFYDFILQHKNILITIRNSGQLNFLSLFHRR